jgi:hypothetical protein
MYFDETIVPRKLATLLLQARWFCFLINAKRVLSYIDTAVFVKNKVKKKHI